MGGSFRYMEICRYRDRVRFFFWVGLRAHSAGFVIVQISRQWIRKIVYPKHYNPYQKDKPLNPEPQTLNSRTLNPKP